MLRVLEFWGRKKKEKEKEEGRDGGGEGGEEVIKREG